jgi:enoyl-[acyl-carrier protein] reductase I
MGLLTDRKILITGVLSNRSIAHGVARACQREGATLAFTYVNDDLKDRVVKLAAGPGTALLRRRDARRGHRRVVRSLKKRMRGLDGLAHAIVRAARSTGGDPEGCRAAPATAHDVSSYCSGALARGARGR